QVEPVEAPPIRQRVDFDARLVGRIKLADEYLVVVDFFEILTAPVNGPKLGSDGPIEARAAAVVALREPVAERRWRWHHPIPRAVHGYCPEAKLLQRFRRFSHRRHIREAKVS